MLSRKVSSDVADLEYQLCRAAGLAAQTQQENEALISKHAAAVSALSGRADFLAAELGCAVNSRDRWMRACLLSWAVFLAGSAAYLIARSS